MTSRCWPFCPRVAVAIKKVSNTAVAPSMGTIDSCSDGQSTPNMCQKKLMCTDDKWLQEVLSFGDRGGERQGDGEMEEGERWGE
jgi:hypothetical protein